MRILRRLNPIALIIFPRKYYSPFEFCGWNKPRLTSWYTVANILVATWDVWFFGISISVMYVILLSMQPRHITFNMFWTNWRRIYLNRINYANAGAVNCLHTVSSSYLHHSLDTSFPPFPSLSNSNGYIGGVMLLYVVWTRVGEHCWREVRSGNDISHNTVVLCMHRLLPVNYNVQVNNFEFAKIHLLTDFVELYSICWFHEIILVNRPKFWCHTRFW